MKPPTENMTMKIDLYHVPQSRSFRTLWLLHELGVPFHLHTMALRMDVLRTPEYLAISALGRVPAAVIDGVAHIESGALAQVLSTRFAGNGLGRAPADADWAEWLQWIHYAETAAVHAASLVQQQVFIPDGQKSEAVRDLESKRLKKALQVLDRHLATQDWMLASGFSAADTSIGYSVHLGKGFIGLDGMPHLAAYYQRCSDRAAFQAANTNKAFS
jgi:glutathione S-transferase